MKKLIALASLSAVVTIACAISAADNPKDDQPDADRLRCVMFNEDGSCTSMPANCPVTGPAHPNNPSCPEGFTLIPAERDNCTQQLICVD